MIYNLQTILVYRTVLAAGLLKEEIPGTIELARTVEPYSVVNVRSTEELLQSSKSLLDAK